jgi:sugar lactone lactonase YvrE
LAALRLHLEARLRPHREECMGRRSRRWAAGATAVLATVGFGLSLAGCEADEAAAPTCSEAAGTICPWAGTGAPGFNADGKSLLETRFYWPVDVTFTRSGVAYVLDWNNHRVRRVTAEGTFETVVGNDFIGDGPEGETDLVEPGAPGTEVTLNHPTQLVELDDGKLLLVAWHNHKLRRYDPATGNVFVVCGRAPGFEGDGGPLADARLNQPASGRLGPDGALYLLDQRNQRIRRVSSTEPDGIIETVVGTGESGFAGDGGDPLAAQVSFPPGSNPPPGGGMAFDAQGRLYFSDILNQRIRRVDFTANTIETVLGDGTTGVLNNPRDVEQGPDGKIYVADELNHRIVRFDPANPQLEVVAGTGAAGDTGDFGPATAAQLYRPAGVAFDAEGNLYVSDTENHRIRMIRKGF